MLKLNLKQTINRYSRLLRVIMGLGLISLGSLSAVALFNHMDIPTFIASLNTKQISVAELQQGKLKSVIFIDVRSPEEYAEDRIAESPLVPLIDIEAGFGAKQVQAIVKARFKDDRPQPMIVLYCARGGRSIKAYQQLAKVDRYSTNKIQDINLNIVVLSGGIKAWRQAVSAQKDAQILDPITLSEKTAIKSN